MPKNLPCLTAVDDDPQSGSVTRTTLRTGGLRWWQYAPHWLSYKVHLVQLAETPSNNTLKFRFIDCATGNSTNLHTITTDDSNFVYVETPSIIPTVQAMGEPLRRDCGMLVLNTSRRPASMTDDGAWQRLKNEALEFELIQGKWPITAEDLLLELARLTQQVASVALRHPQSDADQLIVEAATARARAIQESL